MNRNILAVKYRDMEVGRIYWDDRSRRAVFEYAPDFATKGIQLAPLSAPVSEKTTLPVVGNREKIFQGLPPFIADSLPDRWGNLVFQQWAAQERIPKKSISPVDKLAFIGKRAMGALEFEPASHQMPVQNRLKLDSLYQTARKIFEGRGEAKVLPGEELSLQALYQVGTSAGGQHPKAILAIDDETGEIRSGQVMHEPCFRYYILKFAEKSDFPFTEIEYVWYRLAQLSGIDIMPSRLMEADGERHFLTERFDRRGGRKIHIQTLAAMMPEAESYEDLFETARRLGLPYSQIEQLFTRTVFNFLSGNVDDHIKNFSFMMDDDGTWSITPAYDVTFTTDLSASAYDNGHSMSLLGKTECITEEDLLEFARLNGIRDAASIIERVCKAVMKFRHESEAVGISRYWIEKIANHLAGLLPDRYSETVDSKHPAHIDAYTTEDGIEVSNARIVETAKHDYHILADIEGRQYKFVIGHKRPLASEISSQGGIFIPESTLKELVEEFIVPKAK